MLKRARHCARNNRDIDFVDIATSRQCSSELGIALEIIAIFLTGETGAGFVDAFELAVAEDLSIRVVELQRSEQSDKGSTLGRRTSIGSTTFLVEASLVTNTNRVGIVMPGMSSDHLLRTAQMELTVTSDVVVVAAAVPAFGSMHLVEQLERQVLVRPACRAVNYNQIYSSHSCVRLEVHAALNDVRTKNRCDDGYDNLKDFLNGIPFNHKVMFLKLYNLFAGLCPAILHHPQPLLHKKGLRP